VEYLQQFAISTMLLTAVMSDQQHWLDGDAGNTQERERLFSLLSPPPAPIDVS